MIQHRQKKECSFSSENEDWVLLGVFVFKFWQSNRLLHRTYMNNCPHYYNWSCQIVCFKLDTFTWLLNALVVFAFLFPKMASKWNRNRHWKWLSLQFSRRKFDHQQPQWNERFWTVSMFNYQHIWQYFKQRGCSSVCMWVTFFKILLNRTFTLLNKALNCNLNMLHKWHWDYWTRI